MRPEPQNPFRDPEAKPEWAQLTRLAGDRAAILFEELRREVGTIEGLVEDLHYWGSEQGWAPLYRLGDATLFTAQICPGVLEVTIELNASICKELLASPKIDWEIKRVIRDTPVCEQFAVVRLRLQNGRAVRAFAGAVRAKGRFIETARAK